MCAVLEVAFAHASKQIQILCDGSLPVRGRPPRLGHRPSIFPDLFLARAVHISEARLDQLDGVFVEALEVIRREVKVIAPVEPEPTYVLLYRADVEFVFRFRVCVVEAKMSDTTMFGGGAEAEADRLRVADV